jgi:plasmid stabilization system protein ParE
MALNVIWSPKAIESFDKIIFYLEYTWGKTTTQKFTQKTLKHIHLISAYPQLFRESEKYKNQFKTVINKQVSLIYRYKPKKGEIELVLFWDNRREPSQLKH